MTFTSDRETACHPLIPSCEGCTPRRQQLNISFLTEKSLTVVTVSRKTSNSFRIGCASVDRACIPTERWFYEKAKYFVVDSSAITSALRTIIVENISPRFDSLQFQFVIDNEYILTPTLQSNLFNTFSEATSQIFAVLTDVLQLWDNVSPR